MSANLQNKATLSERDICTKFVTPALVAAGWDLQTQIREEVSFTKGRVIVRGKMHTRGKVRRADFVLSYKPNLPLALIEAKDAKHTPGDGMAQALDSAAMQDIPFVFSTNGSAFLFHDRTIASGQVEKEIPLDAFPSPAELWARYCAWKELGPSHLPLITQDYYTSTNDRPLRYYQLNAVNRTIEAIAKGRDRILLVMATGTGNAVSDLRTHLKV